MAETGGVFRIENGKPAEIKFTATFARFIRMVISKTLNQGLRGISEAWVVPSGFENYSVADLENYIQSLQIALLESTSPVLFYGNQTLHPAGRKTTPQLLNWLRRD